MFRRKNYAQYYEQMMKFYERYVSENNYTKLSEIYAELVSTEGVDEEKKKELNLKFFKDAFGNMDYGNPLVSWLYLKAKSH